MKNLNGYKIVQDYISRTGELWHTEVFDLKGKRIVLKDHISNELIKTYYLEGKILYDENGEIDIAYKKESHISFKFENGTIKTIDLSFDEPYFQLEKFLRDYQELLPFMTPEILAYFSDEELLVPNSEL
jgi:hypothetical protein